MSTETPTPRVDAVALDEYENWEIRLDAVTDFARQLERENAELRGKLERLAGCWDRSRLLSIEAQTQLGLCAEQLRAILNQ